MSGRVMLLSGSVWLTCLTLTALADDMPRGVQPPAWSKDVLDAFFDDARAQLVGSRPLPKSEAADEQVAGGALNESSQLGNEADKWSELIDADTLTAEIKRLNNQLATALKKSSSFQAGGNLDCRRNFGLLAVLFGVIKEFDGEVRYQRSAQTMEQNCLQASHACQTASAESYALAQSAQTTLSELLRGQAPSDEQGNRSSKEPTDESQLADRAQLMRAMELAMKGRVSPALSNARDFRKRAQQVGEQAQLLAALALVIQREGYEYADDDTFLDEARQLRDAAQELVQAANDKNYDAARAAAGRMSQSCSSCHEGYRG